MKKFFVSVGICVCFLLSSVGSYATNQQQDPQQSKEFKEIPNPEKAAKRITDEMQKELQLTDKQYKKIYKLNLSEQKEMVNEMSNRSTSRQFPGGDGQRPPMNGGGGGPQGGGFGGERPAGPPPSFSGNGKNDMQERIEKKNKKIKKILTDSQYQKWTEYSQKQFRQGRPDGNNQPPRREENR